MSAMRQRGEFEMDSHHPQPQKLLDRVRNVIRLKNYAYSTEKAYVRWIKRFILFHHMRYPHSMVAAEVEAFLTHLAVKENVVAATQNQALCALIFLYNQVLQQELSAPIYPLWAKKPERLPVVLTRGSACRAGSAIWHLSPDWHLALRLRHAIIEGLRLRVQDVDFGQNLIVVRQGKGDKDRVTLLPERTKAALQEQLASALSHVSSQLRHPPARSRLRYPHRAGTLGS
jgi:integrase